MYNELHRSSPLITPSITGGLRKTKALKPQWGFLLNSIFDWATHKGVKPILLFIPPVKTEGYLLKTPTELLCWLK
jgi:hypothetical protein